MRQIFASMLLIGAGLLASEQSPADVVQLPAVKAKISIVVFCKEKCRGCDALKLDLATLGVSYSLGSGDALAGVKRYPTIVLLADGKEVGRVVDWKNLADLSAQLKSKE